MDNLEKIMEASIAAKIYDTDLAQKVQEVFVLEKPAIDPSMCFKLEIIFDRSVYRQAVFYQYPTTIEHKGPAPKTEQEKTKQKIYDVLTDQLKRISDALKEIGYKLNNTAIIGDDLEDDVVQVLLYRDEPSIVGKGKRQTELSTSSIMPDRPYLVESAAKIFAEIFSRKIQREMEEDIVRKNHTPVWVSASTLFSAIAAALAAESVDEEKITDEMLMNKAFMETDWPLHIRSKSRADDSETITGETQIDCPEYILFQLNHGGSWDLKKVDNLKMAQHFISNQGFKRKQTKAILVLQNLKPISYSLFAEGEDGIVPVLPLEAYNHKKLYVSWKKAN